MAKKENLKKICSENGIVKVSHSRSMSEEKVVRNVKKTIDFIKSDENKSFVSTTGLTPNKVREILGECNEEAIVCDGLEEALIGIGYTFNKSPIAVYDKNIIIDIYIKRDGMTYEEAEEFFEYNVLGSYCGEHTPIFIDIYRRKK
jgi:hypothetical protein